MLNQAPHHKYIWGIGGTAPHIFNCGTRLRWVVSFMS